MCDFLSQNLHRLGPREHPKPRHSASSRNSPVSILSEQHIRRHWVAGTHAKHTTSVSNVRLPAPSSLVGDLEELAALRVLAWVIESERVESKRASERGRGRDEKQDTARDTRRLCVQSSCSVSSAREKAKREE